jgi:hypothetical protein
VRFEITEDEPIGAEYKIFLVHCGDCGAPFGAMEYLVAGVLLRNQQEVLAQIQQSLSDLDARVRRIGHALNA